MDTTTQSHKSAEPINNITLSQPIGYDLPFQRCVSTPLCRQCGHTFKVQFRVRAASNKEKLHSRYTPTDSESTIISQLLKECEDDLGKFQKEIDTLRRTTAKLERDMHTLELYVKELRCISAPVRKLPPEILIEIFRNVCSVIDKEAGNDLRSRKIRDVPTLVLASVCSAWREIVVSTPSLWSHFSMSDDPAITSRRLLNLFLERASTTPLHFHLESSENDYGNFTEILNAGDRWGSACLNIPNLFTGIDILPQLAFSDFPRLTRLEVNCGNSFGGQLPFAGPRILFPLRTEIPHLRSISLRACFISPVPTPNFVQELDVTAISPRDVVSLLESCSMVTNLTIRYCVFQVERLPSIRAKEVKNLLIRWNSFHESFPDGRPSEILMQLLTVPKLESLKLMDDDVDFLLQFHPALLKGLLERSKPSHLKSLELWNVKLDETGLLDILKDASMENLTHLAIRELPGQSTVGEAIIQGLTRYA
ncbi:hypothetical protein K435DRAFT_62057 [Dendrothele bispora CBS 962.96]|uniref:F-box domain-containing protein n=1 Tax=Dendrothele bispora (strain CBS 962.96) TaxID=1314807 RepID=A0A4S8MRV9_DENBC|nr:hypothetical protein K435DRAFT_62057 [Dendrothele bispora CBS 962.96]